MIKTPSFISNCTYGVVREGVIGGRDGVDFPRDGFSSVKFSAGGDSAPSRLGAFNSIFCAFQSNFHSKTVPQKFCTKEPKTLG